MLTIGVTHREGYQAPTLHLMSEPVAQFHLLFHLLFISSSLRVIVHLLFHLLFTSSSLRVIVHLLFHLLFSFFNLLVIVHLLFHLLFIS